MQHNINNKVHNNYIKAVVRTNMFRPKIERDKTKFKRNPKHKGSKYD